MNEISSFTFYDNYYELLDNLPKEDKLLMLEAIVDYVFKDKEPMLEGLNKAIWNNIKMPIDTSKNNSKRRMKPKENQKRTETKPKQNRKETNNISTFLFLISNFNYLKDRGLLRGKIEEWIKYKWERKEYYKETGFKSLLTQIKNNTEKYGEENIIELITECMANNWKGIIFDKLKGKEKTIDKKILEKFDGVKVEERTEDEKRKIEAIRNGTWKP